MHWHANSTTRYNLIKYDIDKRQPVSVSIIAEEIIGAGTKNMLLHLI
jgi:hypothetical protein